MSEENESLSDLYGPMEDEAPVMREYTDDTEGMELDLPEADEATEKLFLEGLVKHNNGEFADAIKLYEQAIKGTKLDKIILNNIGVSYRHLGEYDKADKAIKNCLKLDKKYALGWENKGILFGDMGKEEESVEYLQKAVELDEKRDNSWLRLGMIHSKHMDLNSAKEAYEKALGVNPENVAALNQTAILYHTLARVREEWESIGLLEKAVSYMERAIEVNPALVETWNNYGLVLGFLGRYKGSISALEEANNISQDYAPAHYNKARIYVITGEKAKALLELKKTVALESDLYKVAQNDLTLRKIAASQDLESMVTEGQEALEKAKEYAREEKRKRKRKR